MMVLPAPSHYRDYGSCTNWRGVSAQTRAGADLVFRRSIEGFQSGMKVQALKSWKLSGSVFSSAFLSVVLVKGWQGADGQLQESAHCRLRFAWWWSLTSYQHSVKHGPWMLYSRNSFEGLHLFEIFKLWHLFGSMGSSLRSSMILQLPISKN